MITVSVKNLVKAIQRADAFVPPEMNDGEKYLYNKVFHQISGGYEVRLSEIDFDAFEADDVDSLKDLYSDVFERNYYLSDGIASALQSISPASNAVGYV